jgi:hypothetical protein
MTAPKRTRGQRERDRSLVARLYLQGETQQAIADAINDRYANQEIEVKLSRITIRNDIEWVRKQWLESSLVDIDEAKAVELAKIDRLEVEYWDAWQQSKKDAETRIAEQSKGGKFGDTTKAVSKKVGQVGNHKFLQGVQWCIEQRVKIFGMHAPQQVDISWRRETDEQAVIRADELFELRVASYLEAIAEGAEPAEFRSVPGSEAQAALPKPESDVDPASGAADISD